YLRDNMVMDLKDQVQHGLNFAVVDEADSILIDEARTPLIISSPAEDSSQTYYTFARVAEQLHPDSDYVVEEKYHAVNLTEDGLDTAVKAKEGLKIQRETRTFATITSQNYFRMYKKLAGMTGTAATEAEELYKVYKLEVTQIPTNKPMVRKDLPDLVYRTEQGKWDAVVQEVKDRNAKGQPVLIGTTSVEKSERLSD